MREIAITPLILNLLTKVPIEDIKNIEKEELLKALWKIYVNRAIGAGDFYNVENKKNDLKLYNGQDARFWLEKLAKHMGNNRTFSFLPENLPEEKETKILYLGSTWFVLLLLGTAAYLLVQYEHVSPWQLLPLLAIIAGFYGYLIIAFLTELYMTVLYILTAVWLSFSVAASIGLTKWQKRKEALTTVAFLFVPVILLNTVLFIWGWVSSLPIWVIIFVVWLIGGLFWYKFYWLSSFGVFQGFIPRYLVANTWLALRNLMVFNQIEEFPLTEKLFLNRQGKECGGVGMIE